MIEWGQIDENIPNPPKLATKNALRMAYRSVFAVFECHHRFIDSSTEGTRFTEKPRYVCGFQNSLELEMPLFAGAITVEEMDLL